MGDVSCNVFIIVFYVRLIFIGLCHVTYLFRKKDCVFDKISLLLLTVLESEARSFFPTVQLEFSWTFEMSDRQNDRFARPSDTLESSVSIISIS